MNGFSTKNWLLVGVLLLLAAGFAYNRYAHTLASVPPQALASIAEGGSVRVLGRVRAGSIQPEGDTLNFVVEGEGGFVQVAYRGPDKETVRELKNLLVSGRRLPGGGMAADTVSIAANYGFVAAAYGLALGLLLAFAWVQERAAGALQKKLESP
ncbi:MAG: cytochrome c maturation protein CcmE [Thiobacillus sp.]|nr:cytochrome c maturation protein CcmE [Thiobacillus sp.]